MRKTILLAILGLVLAPGAASAASPLRLECAAEQAIPARALVCEYTLLARQNEQLAGLHEGLVQAGRAGRVDALGWLTGRDACRDVDCLDRMFDAGMREAKLALVDVESRKPAVVLSNAQGVAMRLAERPARRRVAPAEEPQAAEPVELWSVREPSRLEPVFSILTVLFLAAVAVYATVVRRIA